MSEEQREVLQMVADGKISADDGAKLLEALSKGNQKRKEMESPARRFREKRRIMLERKGMLPGIDLPGMREVGRMMRGIMRDSTPGSDEDEFINSSEDMCEDAGVLDASLELEEGTELILKRRVRRNGGGGDLILNGVSGSKLEVLSEDPPEIRVFRDGSGTVLLKWDKGDLELNIPETVESVRASILGGDIVLDKVAASAEIKTRGGDITMSEVTKAFRAKTMGGDILITLTENWNEDSKATTMGGDVTLGISEKTKAIISAKTMGGEITVQDDMQGVTESGHPGASRVNIDLSDDEDSPELRVKTMGGNIKISHSGSKLLDEIEDNDDEHQEDEETINNE